MPRGVYPRQPRKDREPDLAPANVVRTPGKKGRKWTRARRAALSEKMRKKVGKHRLTPTLEAAVLVSKMNDIVLARIRDGSRPDGLDILVLQAHRVLTTIDE